MQIEDRKRIDATESHYITLFANESDSIDLLAGEKVLTLANQCEVSSLRRKNRKPVGYFEVPPGALRIRDTIENARGDAEISASVLVH